ncbi:adenylyltransferase/cytidyltransferase family protein [bacterium]|nr:adenylyltransferase/cytidyltransferase family protein [bacterium]MDB0072661.1 adenylyltransferase/cytidyltransferase family protein [bacterium]MDB4234969.1 adenylyltransferase/cytidyltransferase family protein [bacterium]MDB4352642.1 adenylyltransferase/cytidyltransferase family protein [Porticoccaceae bacterium]
MGEWKENKYVSSSLESKDSQYAMFIGRWQPLHDGHKELFSQAFNKGKNVLICIREGVLNDKNPFTSEEVKQNITIQFQNEINDGKVKVIIIPDICSVEFGRGVGYDIIEHIPPTKISNISATKVREKMREEGKL